jgi:hypothetical protein
VQGQLRKHSQQLAARAVGLDVLDHCYELFEIQIAISVCVRSNKKLYAMTHRK